MRVLARLVGAARRLPTHSRLAQVSDEFELAGIGCLVWGGWSWNSHLGPFILGAALIYVGVMSHEPSKA
jgi:hypothetical protein